MVNSCTFVGVLYVHSLVWSFYINWHTVLTERKIVCEGFHSTSIACEDIKS